MSFPDAAALSVAVGALAIGYFSGAIPFGLLLTRFAGTADLRTIGSGNIGATNVLRTGRKDLAALTLLLDGLKGTFAVLLASWLFGGVFTGQIAAAGAFLGHVFPVWLHFKGGKGVATFLGCLLALCWPAGLVFILVWLGVALVSKYSSAAALIASALSPLALVFFGAGDKAPLFLALAAALWYFHRANISRLLAGTEGKIGQKS